MEEKSQFLYHESAKEIYSKYLDQLSESECVHSRALLSFVDFPENDSRKSQFLEKHINSCRPCRDNLSKMRGFFLNIEKNIPAIAVNREIQINFETEVSDLFIKSKIFDRPQGVVNSRQVFKDFFKVLLMKEMISVYFLSALCLSIYWFYFKFN